MTEKQQKNAKPLPLCSGKSNSGFSLLEILVVVVIIGIVVSAVSFAFGDSQADRMSHKTKQLAALIDLAKEHAVFNSQELGVLFTKDSYAFYRMDTVQDKNDKEKNVWLAIEGDKFLNKRTLPDGLEYELHLEGTEVAFAASNLEEVTPHVFILSDGSVSTFELNLTDKIDYSYQMIMSENGEYEIKTAD